MSWYEHKGIKTALRKHMLRVDMRIYCGDPQVYQTPSDLANLIKSMLGAAIIKGLDVVGVVGANGPQMGLQAQQLAKQQGLDIYVIPCEEYMCADKIKLFIYNLTESMRPNLTMDAACAFAHQNRGFVMISGLTKRLSSQISQSEGNPNMPDAVEIYNAQSGGFQDLDVTLPKFITSCAKSATELEQINVFTLIGRKDVEGMGLLPENEGSEYVPKYLERDDELQQGATPDAVADGNAAPPQQMPSQPPQMVGQQ